MIGTSTGTSIGHTVCDFKTHTLQESGDESCSDFCGKSDTCRSFWMKLNGLGARNMSRQPPETVPDIDATVVLSDKEWHKLDHELQGLLQK